MMVIAWVNQSEIYELAQGRERLYGCHARGMATEILMSPGNWDVATPCTLALCVTCPMLNRCFRKCTALQVDLPSGSDVHRFLGLTNVHSLKIRTPFVLDPFVSDTIEPQNMAWRLTSLNMSGCSLEANVWKCIVSACTSLLHFSCEGGIVEDGSIDPVIAALVASATKVISVNIAWTNATDASAMSLATCTIQRVKMQGCNITSTGINRFLALAVCLEHLNIRDCEPLWYHYERDEETEETDDRFPLALSSLPVESKLRELVLGYFPSYDTRYEYLLSIKEVQHLWRCSLNVLRLHSLDINSDSVDIIARTCRRIHTIDLSWCNVDNDDMETLAKNLACIRDISIRGTNVTDDGIDALVRPHPSSGLGPASHQDLIQHLDLSWLKITHAAFHSIARNLWKVIQTGKLAIAVEGVRAARDIADMPPDIAQRFGLYNRQNQIARSFQNPQGA